MARKDMEIWATHKKLREEAERIIDEAKKSKKINLNLLQATYLSSIKSKRGIMSWEEAWAELERAGLL